MKEFYENRTRNFLPRRTYTIIRVDGKAFHSYTRGLVRPFDEKLQRLQDWDVWLTMLEQGKRGIYCDDLIFTTQIKPGITYDKNLNPFKNHEEARQVISKKHNLGLGIQA